MASDIEKAPPELQRLVEDTDTGGRRPGGLPRRLIFWVAVLWSLFQLFQISPIPFALGWGILNDTEVRSIHLGFALFLGYLVWPAFKTSPRDHIPLPDWICAVAGGLAGAYLYLAYAQLAERPGAPSMTDLITAGLGMLLLLEATRRAVGAPMAVLAVLFCAYALFGPMLPEVLQHKGASVNRLLSHMWLTTEGVYGVALGVSSGAIFIYVLFGALLDKAGGGNYMMQVSHAALGHLRGGPAKVAVVSSGLNGMISGSSVSNVVSGGIFTIPLMKKAGYGGVKAGAIETMSSVDGQIMPPVMGAAAFLMVEYVGIPYSEVVRHAILPALLSYLGLFYLVHLEAMKMGLDPIIRRAPRTLRERAIRMGLGVSGTVTVIGIVYFLLSTVRATLGAAAGWGVAAVMGGLYLVAIVMAAREPDLPTDIDIDNPRPLEVWPTVKAGLHFLMPIGTLVWCLMIEEMSPGLAAFWAVVVLMGLMATQRALIGLFRGAVNQVMAGLQLGCQEVVEGLHDGARNMIGVGIATATAGIIVGGISLTGLGLRMTEFVEFVAQGDVIVMLLFTAFVCLVLGLGVPTTANYVLMATLMAPVVVELGAQNGMIIPLIAVHMFVFYYGIMGDITPPVGLATFAAAAISGESAIATGIQGAKYAARTVILPFIWIFNPQLLLINVHSWFEGLLVAGAALMAMIAFTSCSLLWFRVRMRLWEVAALVLAMFFLFRPDYFMDRIAPEYRDVPPAEIMAQVAALPDHGRLVTVIRGMSLEGDDITKTVALQLGEAGADGRKRLADAGLTVMPLGDSVQITAVRFGSAARKGGFEQGFDIIVMKQPSGRPSAHWFYLPGMLLFALVWWAQGRRMRTEPATVTAPRATASAT